MLAVRALAAKRTLRTEEPPATGTVVAVGVITLPPGTFAVAATGNSVVRLEPLLDPDSEAVFEQKLNSHGLTTERMLPEQCEAWTDRITRAWRGEDGEAIAIAPVGTAFQRRVWMALREVAFGSRTTYADLAEKVGSPGAARAVGSAVGANGIALLIPCHRVLRTDGNLGGFRWGLPMKRALLEAETVEADKLSA